MSVIFLFIDGVGLGQESPDNPLLTEHWESLSLMSGGQPFSKNAEPVSKKNHFFTGVDATLGVDGLPQSGTGQTALFTGRNAAKKIGKHFGPYPHSKIKPLLRRESLFIKAQAKNKSCMFINAYPDIFFKKAEAHNRWSCTTLMTKSANIKLNTAEEVKNEAAITAGITQKAWREKLGIDVPEITPEAAANRLINQSVNCELLLHEYYLTDKAGHGRKNVGTTDVLTRYDRFLMELIQKPEDVTIVLSSDHGNVEDLSIKTHTYNQVPLFVLGPGAEEFQGAKSILDVTPGILRILD